MTTSRRRSLRGVALATLTVTALLIAPGAASAQESFARGPAPTVQSLEATAGPFLTLNESVSASSTPGFGLANITYPMDLNTFGIVAIAPGFFAPESEVAWLRTRIASHGFVVITFESEGLFDQPTARGQQLLAALDYVSESASWGVRLRADPTRRAVMGHSMGGGGALYAAATGSSIEAAIPLAGFNDDKDWPEVNAPVLVLGMENDTTAPNAQHSLPFYDSLTGAEERAYVEIRGAGHSTPTQPNTPIASSSIAWLKRFVDNDDRYTQFVCPPPGSSENYSTVRSSCPID